MMFLRFQMEARCLVQDCANSSSHNWAMPVIMLRLAAPSGSAGGVHRLLVGNALWVLWVGCCMGEVPASFILVAWLCVGVDH
jgi:hypothetical protein